MKLLMNRLASVLREERMRSDLSVRELSRLSRTPMKDLVDLEWRLKQDIDCLTLIRVAKSLNMEIADLFDLMGA